MKVVRPSTIERLTKVRLNAVMTMMRELSCGFIVRLKGVEHGILSVVNGMLLTDEGLELKPSQVYVRCGMV